MRSSAPLAYICFAWSDSQMAKWPFWRKTRRPPSLNTHIKPGIHCHYARIQIVLWISPFPQRPRCVSRGAAYPLLQRRGNEGDELTATSPLPLSHTSAEPHRYLNLYSLQNPHYYLKDGLHFIARNKLPTGQLSHCHQPSWAIWGQHHFFFCWTNIILMGALRFARKIMKIQGYGDECTIWIFI